MLNKDKKPCTFALPMWMHDVFDEEVKRRPTDQNRSATMAALLMQIPVFKDYHDEHNGKLRQDQELQA